MELLDTLQNLIVEYGLNLLGSIAILVLGIWLAKQLVKGLRGLLQKARVDQTLITFFANISYYVLLIIVIIAALNNVGIRTTTVVAVFGAATLAIGLALQNSLSNVAAGVLIIMLQPYRSGDYVEINDVEGYVANIKMFHTSLKTRDNKIIFVPNSEALAGNITNYSKEKWIRLDLVYGIGYDDDLLKAKQILQEIMETTDQVASQPAPVVAVKELGDSSVNLAARPFVKVRDYVPVTFAITEQVKLRFDAAGISIPFPQRDIHLYPMAELALANGSADNHN
jgi:small conductance mechanosensitive channel